jgi:hypothetical protein
MMFYLQAHILSVPGVRELLESPKGTEIGRYSLLVDKEQFEHIRATLRNALPTWVKNFVESDALPTETQFPGPARVKPLFDDGLSSGENSWMTTSNASFMSIEIPSGQDDDFFKTSMNASRIFTFDDIPTPPTKPTSMPSSPTKGTVHKVKDAKLPAWSTATSELTEIETQQQQEIERLTAERAHATQASLKSVQIIEEQRAEIEALKAQRAQDIENRAREVLEAKTAQSDEATRLRDDLRSEMKLMMEQFMLSFHQPKSTPTTPESNKRSIANASEEANNSPPREKRRDDRPTPAKLFLTDTNLRDSATETDAMDATVSPTLDDDL